MTHPAPTAPPRPSLLRRRARRGFTLVELLIVVIILAILAAVVIPQFGDTSASAKETALVSNLQTIRQAIALYRVQHDENYPGAASWSEFVNQLTSPTNQDGTIGGPYGPYLRTGFPVNPVTNTVTGTNVTTMPAGPAGTEAYVYSPANGEIRANVPGVAPSGTNYWDL